MNTEYGKISVNAMKISMNTGIFILPWRLPGNGLARTNGTRLQVPALAPVHSEDRLHNVPYKPVPLQFNLYVCNAKFIRWLVNET